MADPIGAGQPASDEQGALAADTPSGAPPVSTPSIIDVALRGACPRCGERSLFANLLGFASRCRACGLEFAQFNVGDGPAAFLTLILGAVVVGLAMWLEISVGPPLWVHMLIWVPFTAAGVVGSLRLAKAALLASEYRNAAREGRIATGPDA